MCMCMCMCMCICVYAYILYAYICICVYILLCNIRYVLIENKGTCVHRVNEDTSHLATSEKLIGILSQQRNKSNKLTNILTSIRSIPESQRLCRRLYLILSRSWFILTKQRHPQQKGFVGKSGSNDSIT